MLLAHPHLCSYIKKLAVRPNYYLAWPKSDNTLDENWVVKMIIDLSKYLKNMHTFDWDGLESPQDQLWNELRIKQVSRLICPSHLKLMILLAVHS